MSAATRPTGLILGAGEGLGAALAQRLEAGGLHLCRVRRTPATGAGCYAADLTDEAQLTAVIERVEHEAGPVALAVFNLPVMVRAEVLSLDTADYDRAMSVARAAFLAGRELARRMRPRGAGTIVFIGATSALRGSARFAATAGARHAIRALAQSMARELGPQGLHVAHVVLDGGLDTPAVRERFPDVDERLGPDALLDTGAVAEACWQLHCQPRSAWTQELVLRPWVERW